MDMYDMICLYLMLCHIVAQFVICFCMWYWYRWKSSSHLKN